MTAKNTTTFTMAARDDASATITSLNARLQSLTATVTATSAAFMKPLKMAGLDSITSRLQGLKNTMASMPVAGTFLAAGGVAMATKGLLDNAAAAHKSMGAIQDLSTKYKVGTDALQVFGEIGADAGVSTESIAKGFGKLQVKIAEAMGGSKEAVESFAAVGIAPKDLAGGAVEVFKKIADLYKAKDFAGADPFKVASARELLGKSGADMIPILDQGGAAYSETLKKMVAENRQFDKSTIASADKTGDAWDASMRRIAALKTTVGLAMGTMLESISNGIAKILDSPARGEMIDTFKRLGETIASEAPKFIAKLPAIVEGFAGVFTGIKKIADLVGWDKLIGGVIFMLASPFVAATVSLTGALWSLTVATSAFIGRLALLAAGGVMAAVRGLVGLQLAFTQVGLSAGVAWAATLAPVVAIAAGIAAIGLAAYWAFKNLDGFGAFFTGAWQGIKQSLSGVGEAFAPIGAAVGAVWGSIKRVLGITDESKKDWSAWANAGLQAGLIIGSAIKALLTPVMLAIDAIKLLDATWGLVTGKGFNFESSTMALLGKPDKQQPFDVKQPLQPPNFLPQQPLDTGRKGASIPKEVQFLQQQQVGFSQSKFDGQLNISINQQGRATVDRVDSSPGFEINANTGFMGA